MTMIGSLVGCAEQHLASYTDRTSARAFWTYDRLDDPDTLGPLDCLAPALLSVRINYQQVIPLFQEAGNGARLLTAMQAVLDHPDSTATDFLTTDLTRSGTAWAAVDAALLTARTDGWVKNLKEVAVTKILHRKRPALVPIFDSRVYAFYIGDRQTGLPAARALFARLQEDLSEHRDLVEKWAAPVTTPDGRPISLLRAADIIIWEHQTYCA